MFIALVRKAADERGCNPPYMEVQLAFVQIWRLNTVYVRALKDFDFKKTH